MQRSKIHKEILRAHSNKLIAENALTHPSFLKKGKQRALLLPDKEVTSSLKVLYRTYKSEIEAIYLMQQVHRRNCILSHCSSQQYCLSL